MPKATSLPWVDHNQTGAATTTDLTPCPVGGEVTFFTSGAALNTGDAVYISAASTVTKSTTQTNANFFMGVVVGGDLLAGSNANELDVIPDSRWSNTTLTGLVASNASGQRVLVQYSGVALVVAGGTVAAGDRVMFDTGTAGRLIAGSTAGQMVGTALTAATVGLEFKILIDHR